MKKTISVGVVLGIVVLAVIGIAIVLDLVDSAEARDILWKVMSVIGIAVVAMIAILFVTKPSNQ